MSAPDGSRRLTVTRSFHFEAAHRLDWHAGACKNLHGHSYRGEIAIAGPLDGNGIVIDFADVAAVLQTEIVDRYDHTYLNDLMDNPTAELLALEIWDRLAGAGLTVTRLRLWETQDSSVEITA